MNNLKEGIMRNTHRTPKLRGRFYPRMAIKKGAIKRVGAA
jgi:hypothetical protein